MEIKELADLLQKNGVVGAGGAGFPTYAKLDKRAETILMNCAECEPDVYKRQVLCPSLISSSGYVCVINLDIGSPMPLARFKKSKVVA